MMFSRETDTPLDMIYGGPPEERHYTQWIRTTMRDAHAFAREYLRAVAKHQK